MSSPHIAFASSASPISAAPAGQTNSALRPVSEAVQPRAFHYTFSTTRTGTETTTRPPPPSLKPSPSPSPLPLLSSSSDASQPSPTFLPRTSSLLPAARVPVKLSSPVTSTFSFPPKADAKPVSVGKTAPAVTLSPPENQPAPAQTSPPPSPLRRALHAPSRSNSSARANNNTNSNAHHRWSTSTGSSRASAAADGRPLVHRHQRSASFSRRLSVDSSASPSRGANTASPSRGVTQTSASPQHTPRKLQKSRPTNNGSPHRASPRPPITDRELPPVPPTPFASLPPIVALPSLEQELQSGPSSLLGRTSTPPPKRPRPHVRHPSSEDNIRSFYFGNAPAAAPAIDKRPSSALATSPPQKLTSTTMQSTEQRPPSRGYRRETTKGSTESTKSRGNRPPSQKAMLSRALQKAHTAVQLDNAGNFEGAREAYTEACELLQQVLYKTPGQEDKQKLEAIRETYTARIDELDQLQLVSAPVQDRPLPQRPQGASGQQHPAAYANGVSEDDAYAEEEAVIETVTVTRVYNDNVAPEATQPRSIPSYSVPLAAAAASASSSSSPRLMQSAFSIAASSSPRAQYAVGPTAVSSSPRNVPSLLNDQYTLQSSFSRSPRSEFAPRAPAWANASASANANANTLQPPAAINPYMPPPLSPRRIAPPPRPFDDAPTYGVTARNAASGNPSGGNGLHMNNGLPGHTRTASHESQMWLDPINETSSSAPSSVHSRSSSLGVRRKHIRAASGATEAEFDAALDDAIEAAYDDGYEPIAAAATATEAPRRPSNFGLGAGYDDDDPISSSMRRVELAKKRVRETEREAQAFERQFRLREQLRQQQMEEEEEEEEELQQQLQQQQRSPPERGLARRDLTTNFLSTGDDSEDEERLLEEMTTAIEDFSLGTAAGMGSKAKPPPVPPVPPLMPPPMQKPPQLPRDPDSSEGSLRGWHRPTTPNAAIAAAAAAASYEHNVVVSPPQIAKGPTYVMPPPPTAALPQLPPQQPHRLPTATPGGGAGGTGSQSPARAGSAMSVRSRRLSGQTMKQLKIETSKLGPPPMFNTGRPPQPAGAMPPPPQHPPRTAPGGFMAQQRQALSGSRPGSSAGLRPGSSAGPRPGSSAAGMRPGQQGPSAGVFGASPTAEHMPPPNFPPPTPPIPQGSSFGDNDSTVGRAGSPSASASASTAGGRPGLRKNFSSSSLRSLRSRNMSVTQLDGTTSDMSPGTPLSNHFVPSSRLPDVPSLPAALKGGVNVGNATSAANANGNATATGMRLLENDFHSPTTPGSPNVLAPDAPVPLEPCPTDMLLRPFWLMRCLYQTLAHPRGGYLSNKLFVPSDVWRVKGVKLKNVDEKVANCELLTDALQSLARVVDDYDADAVLKEMEALEQVLEQVQAVLARRLGSEVGVQSTHALFKDASPEEAGGAAAATPGTTATSTSTGSSSTNSGSGATSGATRTGSVSNNARSFSWRRLRPKNSSAGLNSGLGRRDDTNHSTSSHGGGNAPTIPSLPMTPHPTSRPAKRDVSAVKFSGPNAAYMRALARLFDAAQMIDQVARQVEDPGLRHADQTQVGLELSTRHAAEFFAFYICRFVLSDVSLLLEKFIKRGSEWVLS